MKRRVCVVTGTRAEYGLLKNIIKYIDQDESLELQIIATGMHLTSEYGNTYQVIESDGYKIDKKIDILLSSGTEEGVAKSMGLAVIGFTDALSELKPDILVLLGDRFEILSAAQTAMILRIPICHVHGGETTEGLIDEAIRHSITKMSHLHFTSTDSYKNRVIQLGEDPERVFNFGAPGLDNIVELDLLNKEDFFKSIEMNTFEKYFLITYHPVSLEKRSPKVAMKEMLDALDEFEDVAKIFTLPNADPNSREIIEMITNYSKGKDNVYVTKSLGQLRYLSAVKHADVVIGNSSSGLIEVPFLKTPTVNIGIRQKGRLSGETVINCADNTKEIVEAIQKSMSDEFIKIVESSKSLYGDGKSSKRIVDCIRTYNLENIIFKKFYDKI